MVLRQEADCSLESSPIALLRLPRLHDRVLDQPTEECQIDEVSVPVDGIRRRRSSFGDNCSEQGRPRYPAGRVRLGDRHQLGSAQRLRQARDREGPPPSRGDVGPGRETLGHKEIDHHLTHGTTGYPRVRASELYPAQSPASGSRIVMGCPGSVT